MPSPRCRLPSILTALLVLAACSDGPPGELIASKKQRISAPAVSSEDAAALATGNTDFSAAVYRTIAKPGENIFFSPFSISQALAMAYSGARGDTAEQMQQALRFTLTEDKLHPAMNALDQALVGRAEQTEGGKNPPPEFRVVNATFAQRGITFEPGFLDTLALHYGAGLQAVDFGRESKDLRDQINGWVEDQTNDRIRGLVTEETVNPDTRLLLINALYFKGAWASPFTGTTRDASFHLMDGGEQQVQMMRGSQSMSYMRGDGFEAAALPYEGKAFRMLFIIPDAGRFEEVETRLSAAFLDDIRKDLKDEDLDLQLPRFQVEQELPLVDALMALGMVDAFDRDIADFSGVTLEEVLYISDARHKAFVSVNEQGTEAAAATAIAFERFSAPTPLVLDRPFLFLIEDVESRAVLFLGRIVKP